MSENNEGVPKVLKVAAAIGGAAAVVGLAKEGLLSDKPEDYQLPTGEHTQKYEVRRSPYYGNVRPEGYSKDNNGKDIAMYFQLKAHEGKIPAIYAEPNIFSETPDFKIDFTKDVIGRPVFGDTFRVDDRNEMGNVVADQSGNVVGYWMKVEYTDAQGKKHEGFLKQDSNLDVGKKVMVMNVGK